MLLHFRYPEDIFFFLGREGKKGENFLCFPISSRADELVTAELPEANQSLHEIILLISIGKYDRRVANTIRKTDTFVHLQWGKKIIKISLLSPPPQTHTAASSVQTAKGVAWLTSGHEVTVACND